MSRLRLVLLLLALFVIALLYQRPTLIAPLNIYDEGIIVFGATRVMDGQVPYRDFWTQYSPAQLYVLAALFKTLGKQIMVERWWDVSIRAALMLGMGALATQLSSRKGGLLVWLIGLLWITYYGFFGYPIFQGLLFSVLSIGAFTKALVQSVISVIPSASEEPRSSDSPSQERTRPFAALRVTSFTCKYFIVSGVLLGIAALFRHDMAVYVGAAQSIVVFGHALTDTARPLPERVGIGLKRWRWLALSAVVTVLPVVIYLLIQVPASELLNQLFIFPLTLFPKVRDLPYPEFKGQLDDLPFYAPFLIYGVAGGIALVRLWHKRDVATAWGALSLVLFGLFGWNQARVRSDIIHTVQFFVPAIVLLPVLIQAGTRRASLPGYICATVAITLTLAFSINPIAYYLEIRKRPDNLDVQRNLKLALPIAQGAQMSSEQIFAVQTIQGLTQPGEMVYVGLSNHSRVFANDVMFYFVMDRPSPTRYHEIHPGLVNTVAVQQEMIADFERHQVRYLVLTNMFEGAREPNDSALDSKITLLDDYIKAHYQQAHTLGSYRILKRRN